MKYPHVWQMVALLAMSLLLAKPLPGHAQATNVEPSVSVPGTIFAFYALGFADNEYVGYWVNTPDGDIIGDPGYAVNASDQGRADWTWRASIDAQPGVYTMVARGGESGRERIIPFEIVPLESPDTPDEPSTTASVAPPVGPPGTVFVFEAEGFQSQERVGYWINAPGETIISGDEFFVLATKSGYARWSVRMADDAVPGFYSMVARGTRGHSEHVIPFEVR